MRKKGKSMWKEGKNEKIGKEKIKVGKEIYIEEGMKK